MTHDPSPVTLPALLAEIRSLGSPENVAGMARFGIQTSNAYGVSVTTLRTLAKRIGRDHRLALELWGSGVHEARILATLVADPRQVTEEQMEAWVREINSWDVCDGCCGNLWDRTPFAYRKAVEWSAREPQFEKRAGFALMAYLAVHDKKAPDEDLLPFLPIIMRESTDERNFVRKAVNWALRQIGKRNRRLHAAAIEAANEIRNLNSKSARWIAADALRELTSEKVQRRLHR